MQRVEKDVYIVLYDEEIDDVNEAPDTDIYSLAVFADIKDAYLHRDYMWSNEVHDTRAIVKSAKLIYNQEENSK